MGGSSRSAPTGSNRQFVFPQQLLGIGIHVLASPCHPLPMELGELFESFHCGLGGVIEVLLPTSQSA